MKKSIYHALVAKKTGVFLCGFIGALVLLISCRPIDPKQKEATPETCIDALMPYFPYSLDEEFIFFNENLHHRIEAKAHDSNKDGIYPDTFVQSENGKDSNSEWSCSVRAFMFNSKINPDSLAWTHYTVEEISAYIANHPSEEASPMEMIWKVALRLDLKNGFIVYWDVHCERDELSSLLKDTITLPVYSIFSYDQTMDTTVIDGSCVHIVKNEGIVDFSLDGQTFWRRVKE